MSYVPDRQNPAYGYPEPLSSAPLTITVHPPSETKRPVGFAPWPEQPKKKPRKRKAAA